MSIRTFLQRRFPNLFIAVIMHETECVLRCKLVKNQVTQKTLTKTFPISPTSESLDSAMTEYLISLQDEYRFVYISYFLNSLGQGAFERSGAPSFHKHNIDIANVHHIAFKKEWSAYASFIEIKWVKNLFSEVGVDFIFSPFVLLNEFIETQKPKTKQTCYILNTQDSFAVSVFEGQKLLFGAFFKTNSDTLFTHSSDVEDWEHEQKQEEFISEVEIPELSLDENSNEIEELDSFSELSELDDMDNVSRASSFSDVKPKTLNHLKNIEDIKEKDVDLELYGRDLLVYKYLKSALEEYYHNPLYKSEFIDEIVILDGYEVSSDLIRQLEDELMMNVEIHKVDLAEQVCDIAIKEVFK